MQVKEKKLAKKSNLKTRKWKQSKISPELARKSMQTFEGKPSSARKIFEQYKELSQDESNISHSTFYRFIKEQLNAKYVKGKLRSERVTYDSTRERVIQFHYEFQWYLKNNFRFVFIDESSFNSAKVNQRIWTSDDSEGILLSPANSVSTSLILAVSNEGAEYYHINPYSTNGEAFKAFMVDLVQQMDKGS